MNDNGMSPADVAAVVDNNRGGYGYGYPMMPVMPYGNFGGFGGGYGDGGWLWLILILAVMNGGWGNGFGNFGGNGLLGIDTIDQSIDSRFLSRDIFSTNQNVSTTGAGLASDICQSTASINSNVANLGYNLSSAIADSKYDTALAVLENRYANQLGQANTNSQLANCCCEIREGIAGVNYNNALQTQTLSSQIATEACADRANSTANTQKILDKLCSMENDNLRTRLGEKEAEIRELQLEKSQQLLAQNIVDQIRPTANPAWLVASPYQSIYNPYTNNGCGCGFSNLA